MNFPRRKIPLVELRLELQAKADLLGLETEALKNTKQRTIHGAVLDGMLPAVRENGRWFVYEDDLPTIAKTIGLIPQRKPGRPRKASSPSNAVAAA